MANIITENDYEISSPPQIFLSDITPDMINNVLNILQFILIIEDNNPHEIVTGDVNRNISNEYVQYLVLRDKEGNEVKRFKVYHTADIGKILNTLSLFYKVSVNGNEIFIQPKFKIKILLFIDDEIIINQKFLEIFKGNEVALQNLFLLISIYNRFVYSGKVGRNTTKKLRLINNARKQIRALADSKIYEYETLVNRNKRETIIILPDNDLSTIINQILDEEETDETYTNFINAYDEQYFNQILNRLSDKEKYVIWSFIITHTAIERQEINGLLNRIERSLQTNTIIRNESNVFELRPIPEDELLMQNARVELNTDIDQLLGLGRNTNQVITEFAEDVLKSYDRLIATAKLNLARAQQEREEKKEEMEEIELENENNAPNPVFDPLAAEESELKVTEEEIVEIVESNIGIYASILACAKGSFPDLGDTAASIYNSVSNEMENIINGINEVVEDVEPQNFNQLVPAFGALNRRNLSIAFAILTTAFVATFSYNYWYYVNTPEVVPVEEIPDFLPTPIINPVVDPNYVAKDAEFLQRQVAQANLVYAMNWSVKRFSELWDAIPSILITLPEESGAWIKWFTIFVITSLTTVGLALNPYLPIAPSFTSVALTAVGTTLVTETAIKQIFDQEGNLLTITKGTGNALATVASGASTVITSGVAGIGVLGALVGIALLGTAGYIIYRGIYKGEVRSNVSVKQKQVFN